MAFDFRDQRGADYSRVGQATEDGDMAGERNTETDRDGELRDGAGAAEKSWQIVGERVFGAGNAGARDEVEEAGRRGGDFGETLVGGSRSAEENRIEVVGCKDAAVLVRFFGDEIGNKDAVGARASCGCREFFE